MRQKISLDRAILLLGHIEENYREIAQQKRQIGESQICPQSFELAAQHMEQNAQMCYWIIEYLEELRDLKQQQRTQEENE